jgi:hypothetical protein
MKYYAGVLVGETKYILSNSTDTKFYHVNTALLLSTGWRKSHFTAVVYKLQSLTIIYPSL